MGARADVRRLGADQGRLGPDRRRAAAGAEDLREAFTGHHGPAPSHRYALLDFDDDYGIAELGIFTARYGYLASRELGALLSERAGHEVRVQSALDEFRRLLLSCPGPSSW
jgi:hypothetical protein